MVATMGSNTYFRVGTGEYNHICEKRLGKHVPQQLYTLWKIESIQEMDYILKKHFNKNINLSLFSVCVIFFVVKSILN